MLVQVPMLVTLAGDAAVGSLAMRRAQVCRRSGLRVDGAG